MNYALKKVSRKLKLCIMNYALKKGLPTRADWQPLYG